MSRGIRTILLLCLLLLLVFQMFRVCERLNGMYPAASLRYSTQITKEQAAQALRFAGQESGVYPVFWTEEKREAAAPPHTLQMTAIGCYGDCSFAWPADFINGAYPGEQEKNACVVSDAAAWKLWGSMDIIGQALKLGKDTYTVCGVFSSEREMVVYSATFDAGFHAVELFGDYEGNERVTVIEFALLSGLGAPDSVVYGPSMQWLAMQAARIPLYLAGLVFAVRFYSCIHPNPFLRKTFWVTFGFIFAALLPVLLAALPNWLVPPAWSDFAYWSRLWQDAKLRIWEWLSLHPMTKDVEAKLCLIQVFCMCGGAILIETLLLFMPGKALLSSSPAPAFGISAKTGRRINQAAAHSTDFPDVTPHHNRL